MVALTTENLANLIGGKGIDVQKIIVADVLDCLVVSTRLRILDTCPDQRPCDKIIRHLALTQVEEKAVGEILAVSREVAEEYFAKWQNRIMSRQSAALMRWHKKREGEEERFGVDTWTCSNSSSCCIEYSGTCMHCCWQGWIISVRLKGMYITCD